MVSCSDADPGITGGSDFGMVLAIAVELLGVPATLVTFVPPGIIRSRVDAGAVRVVVLGRVGMDCDEQRRVMRACERHAAGERHERIVGAGQFDPVPSRREKLMLELQRRRQGDVLL
jgi:hypothetical protein